MWTRRMVVGALLLAALLLAGCDNRSADRKTMDTKFEQLDYQISNLELSTAATYNQPHFAAATGRYIRLVRHYADLLGPKEARKRLTEAADGISSYCLPCAGQLADEASRY